MSESSDGPRYAADTHSKRELDGSNTSTLSSAHMRTILDTAMDGIISTDEEQKIIYFNRAAEEIFGWKVGDVLGRDLDILIPHRYVEIHRKYVEQFGKGLIQSRRMSVQRTVSAIRKSGEEFPIEASISQTAVDNKRIFTVILRDVSEAVRRREQLQEQLQMLDQVSDAVSVVDATGRIKYWNHGAINLFGWSAEDVIGCFARDMFFSGESGPLDSIIRETNRRGFWSGELTKTTCSGKTVIVDHRRTILRDKQGCLKGYLCIDIDITNRKKQERLSLRSQRLESIGTLAGGIAHDLNNVLTPILMGAKLLSSNRATANRQGLLDTLVASAERGAALIQQLLAFAGGIQGDRHPVKIDELVRETRSLLEHTFPKAVSIETRIDKECPQVLGDATELTQILMNLCINARDAMDVGGHLIIQAEPVYFSEDMPLQHPDAHSGSYVLLKVSDDGCGMTSDVLDRIFDPFFTTKEIGKGTGLGLATVQGIVKSHGGFILVYSEPGRGSTFSVYLPSATTTHSKISGKKQDLSNSGNGRLILLVDDEQMILQMTSAVLESGGYRVLTASDGSSAVETFSKHCKDIFVVMLDMMMPGMDGFQTIQELQRTDRDVKIIVCSGLSTSQRESSIVAAGAKLFLPKPYSDQQLFEALERIAVA